MFGLRECDRFGAPPKRLLGGVVGFYEALGGLLARYFVRAGGLGRPFLFKWGAAAQKIVGCVLSPVWVNPVSSTDSRSAVGAGRRVPTHRRHACMGRLHDGLVEPSLWF